MTTPEAARLLGIGRMTLFKIMREVPRNLPGAPRRLTDGRTSRWRWKTDELAVWFDAACRARAQARRREQR